MFKELDTVVLAKDLKKHQLTRGDVGAVAHVYEGGKAYEVEFVTGEGKTIAVLTLERTIFVPCSARTSSTCVSLRPCRC